MLSFNRGGSWLLPLLLVAVAAVPSQWQQPNMWQQQQRYPPVAPRKEVPTALDLALMQQVTDNLAENEAISPFVVSTLMTQVYLGAAGSTRDEMTPVLGLEKDADTRVAPDYLSGYRSAIDYLSSNSSNVTVAVFNRMYVRNGFSIKPSFSSILSAEYDSAVQLFSSPARVASEINEAVSNVTQERIQDLVSAELLRSAELVLVSALYFKALWQHPFNPAVKAGFLTADGERQVDMMSLDAGALLYANLTTFEAVAVPYTDPDYFLLLLRPPERSMASVQALRDILGTLNIADIVGSLFQRPIYLTLPKFKIEAEYSLPDQLSTLGIQKIFSPDADFSGITDDGGLFVSNVIHKVFMEVTEEGTEAAGAAAAIFTRAMPMHFALDRPFFAVVYNKQHKLNLFSAYVASPTTPEHEYISQHGEKTLREKLANIWNKRHEIISQAGERFYQSTARP